MLCGETTFTVAEVRAELESEGFTIGTHRFASELHRRYQRANQRHFIENPDWDGLKLFPGDYKPDGDLTPEGVEKLEAHQQAAAA